MSVKHGRAGWLLAPALLVMSACSRPELPLPARPLVPTPDANFRMQPPPVGDADASAVPEVKTAVLGNGLTFWFARRTDEPYVSLSYVSARGGVLDACSSGEMVHLTARAVTEGGLAWSDGREVEPPLVNGVPVRFEVATGSTRLRLPVLTEELPEAVTVLARTVQFPLLDPTGFERVLVAEANAIQRRSGLQTVMLKLASEGAIGRAASERLAPIDMDRLKTAELREVKKCYAEVFRPEFSAVIAVGDATFEDTLVQVERAFGEWVPREKSPPIARPSKFGWSGQPQVHLALQHDDAQVPLLVLQPAPTASSETDEVAFGLLARVVAGSILSRTNLNLRHGMGLTYGVQPTIWRGRDGALFGVSTNVSSDGASAALESLLATLRELHQAPVPPAELRRMKNVFRSRLDALATDNMALASELASFFANGHDSDRLNRIYVALDAMSARDLHSVARRYLRPDAAQIAAAGPDDMARELGFVGQVHTYSLFRD